MKINPGDILISKPFNNEGYFNRTVILITEHNETGSVGFVMNKPMQFNVQDVLPGIQKMPFRLFEGGPVSVNQLFYVHTMGEEIEDSLFICNNWFWGGHFASLINTINNRKLLATEIRFFIGYSGWSEGQLEEEIRNDSWLLAKGNMLRMMKSDPVHLWGNELKSIKSSFSFLADFADDPSMN